LRSDSTNTQAGGALLELLIGAAILMSVLSAMTLAMVSQGRLRRTTEEHSLAMTACRNNLEALRELAFSTLPSLNNTGFDVPASDGSPGALRAVAGDADGLPGRILVTTDQSSGTETLRLVRLIVTWQGVSGRQEVEMKSLVSDRKKT
jgi:hypothetical protein